MRRRTQALTRQQGIALVQVIITTAIILLLSIYYLSAAKSQVERAKALQDKSAAYMALYSAKNKVLYALLTSSFEDMRAQGWNFHGQPVKVGKYTTVAIQDLNGLLSLASMTQVSMLQHTLARSIDPQQAQVIAQSVKDWIDPDNSAMANGAEQDSYLSEGITVRNGPIQTYSEFAFIHGMTYEAEQAMIKNTTVHPTPFFNPMTAPEDVLAAYTDEGTARSVIAARGSKNYNRTTVREITSVDEDEGIKYLLGPGFRLTINSKVGESYFGKILEYGIYPYRERPVEVLSRLPRQQRTTR